MNFALAAQPTGFSELAVAELWFKTVTLERIKNDRFRDTQFEHLSSAELEKERERAHSRCLALPRYMR
jgi:hypothetical protein